MASDDIPRWQVHGEKSLYDNPWVDLVQVDVTPPGKSRFWHHGVRLHHVSIALVTNDNDQVLMLRRHRFFTDQIGWELPGGIVGSGETACEAARRETTEETGWKPSMPAHPVSRFEPMPGMVSSLHEVWRFDGAKQIGAPTDTEESGEVAWIARSQIPDMIARQEILGAGSMVGLFSLLASSQA